MDYSEFILAKCQYGRGNGFEPIYIPSAMFDFQAAATVKAIRTGRFEIMADCGLGKSFMELVWADNVVKKTNKPVILATPIAVGKQMLKEAEKFGIEAERTKDGKPTPEAKIYITNYEQLHKYDPKQFGGAVGDEASCIKDAKSKTKATVVEFMRCLPYRLLATATAAPNDYHELGTSSEALGYLGYRDMLTKFFKMEQKKGGKAWGRTRFRFIGHAEHPFWQWVCSWAMCFRKPSDIGNYDDSRYTLPPIVETEVVVSTKKARKGMLFPIPARDLQEQQEETRNSVGERCEEANRIACELGSKPCVFWANLNPEADRLCKVIDGARQVSGSMCDEEKEEVFDAFSNGELKRLVIKPKIGAFGLNWQHCCNTVVFPSHSFERYYQLVHRFHRFGQTEQVNVTCVVNEGELGILDSLKRKALQTSNMFDRLVKHMNDPLHLLSFDQFENKENVPQWLS